MNKTRLHFWFIANLAILLIVYFKVFMISRLTLPLVLLTAFLVKPKEEIKRVYTAKMSKTAIIISFLFVLLLLISAVTGTTLRMNQYYDNHPSIHNVSIVIWFLILIAVYFVLLRKSKGTSNTNMPVHSDAPKGGA